MSIPISGIKVIDDLRQAKLEVTAPDEQSMLKHLRLQEERDLKSKLVKVQSRCDKRKRKNQELDVVVIPDLENRLSERYAKMSDRNRTQIEELDVLYDNQ